MVNQPTSSVQLVRTALIDTIRQVTVGMAEGRDVQVTRGISALNRTQDDVQIGDVRNWNREITQLRGGADQRHKRNESYEIDINIYVSRQDPDEAEYQTWAIWNAIDNMLASDPSLGHSVNIPTLVVGRECDGFVNLTYDQQSQGWRTRILMRVSVTNKI